MKNNSEEAKGQKNRRSGTTARPHGTKKTYFIGLSRDSYANDWNWVTGEDFVYSNWDIGEQNSTDENYVHMYKAFGNVGTWNNSYEETSGYVPNVSITGLLPLM